MRACFSVWFFAGSSSGSSGSSGRFWLADPLWLRQGFRGAHRLLPRNRFILPSRGHNCFLNFIYWLRQLGSGRPFIHKWLRIDGRLLCLLFLGHYSDFHFHMRLVFSSLYVALVLLLIFLLLIFKPLLFQLFSLLSCHITKSIPQWMALTSVRLDGSCSLLVTLSGC